MYTPNKAVLGVRDDNHLKACGNQFVSLVEYQVLYLIRSLALCVFLFLDVMMCPYTVIIVGIALFLRVTHLTSSLGLR